MSEKIAVVYHPDYLIHTDPGHPERKERLDHIIEKLNEEDVREKHVMIEPEKATIEDIALIHDRTYIESIKKACESNARSLDMDTYIVPESYEVALRSAGGALRALDEIMEGEHRKAFSIGRPPGHHAERDRAMGFCLFNNIAIAAQAAIERYGMRRIAIIDWDVHHGNGTQNSFEEDERILFFSVHQSPAYPGTGSIREAGRERGEGYTINVPLPGGCGDDDYRYVFDEILVPVLKEYSPQIIMVSAGQDAYHRDMLAGMNLTLQSYFDMASTIRALAAEFSDNRILACMEGGYHLEGQANAVISALNGFGEWNLPVIQEIIKRYEGEMVKRSVKEVKRIHKEYWKSLK